MVKFMDDLSAELRRVYNDYPAYRKLVKEKGVKNLNDIIAYGDNPSSWGIIDVPSTLLKINASGGAFQNFANTKIAGKWYLSSATDNDPSAVYLTNQDTQNIQDSYKLAYEKVKNTKVGLWFTPDIKFQKMQTNKIILSGGPAYPYSILGTYGANSKVQIPMFLVEFNRELERPDVNSEKLSQGLETILKNRETAILGGFVLYMYFPVLSLAQEEVDLTGFSVITGGGGYSGRKGPTNIGQKQINKSEFYEILSSLGIIDFVDNYGSTENRTAFSGKFDPSIGDHRYTVPKNTKMIVVDQKTSEPVNVGELGTPIVASPYTCEGNSLVLTRQDGDLVQVLKKNNENTVIEFTNIQRLHTRDYTQIIKKTIRKIISKLK